MADSFNHSPRVQTPPAPNGQPPHPPAATPAPLPDAQADGAHLSELDAAIANAAALDTVESADASVAPPRVYGDDGSEMFPIAPHNAAAEPLWRNLRRPLDFLLSRQLTRPVTSTQVANLNFFWKDGIGAAASEGLALSYIPLFAVALGATTGQVGWLAAIGNLVGALALFPGARMLEKTGQRKPLVVWSFAIGYRLPLLLLALLPLVIPSAAWAFPLILVLNCIRIFSANFANPAWTSLTADLVPKFMRGRFFSMRNMLMGIATLIATPFAGMLIRSVGTTADGGESPLGYQAAFVLSFVAGMYATWQFARIREPRAQESAPDADKKSARRPLRDILRQSPGLMGFVVSAFVWNMSIQIAAPYFNVYMVTHLGGTTAVVGITAAISSVFALVGQFVFGKVLDRKGSVWVFLICGFPIVLLPVVWYFYTNAWQVAYNNVFGGFFWAGFTLANFNLLLLLTPDDQRPRAVALYQTAVFGAAVIGPLIGGYVAENIDYKLIFWLSGAGRLAGMLIFVVLGMRAAFAEERQAAAAA